VKRIGRFPKDMGRGSDATQGRVKRIGRFPKDMGRGSGATQGRVKRIGRFPKDMGRGSDATQGRVKRIGRFPKDIGTGSDTSPEIPREAGKQEEGGLFRKPAEEITRTPSAPFPPIFSQKPGKLG
jgi:beta-glucosidase-like glycosyl hydrolase